MGAHDSKLITVPLFSKKTLNINVSLYAAPKLALVPVSRSYCDVNWSYHNLVPSFIRIERGSDWAHDFKLNNFARKPVNFNVLRSAAPKLALVPASCYKCDIKQSNLTFSTKFH